MNREHTYKAHPLHTSGPSSLVTQSTKYFVSCQDKVGNGNTDDWLEVLNVLRLPRSLDKSRLHLALFEKRRTVVVKISDKKLNHEFRIGEKLKGVQGVIPYICYFTCKDNYLEHPKNALCKGPGTSMQVLVMPYFPLGSIASFAWKASTANAWRSCLLQATLTYLTLFLQHGVLHGDFHTGNVCIKRTKTSRLEFNVGGQMINVVTHGFKAVLMDFEASKDGTISASDGFYDLSKFFTLLATFQKNVNMDTVYPFINRINQCSMNRMPLTEILSFVESILYMDFKRA